MRNSGSIISRGTSLHFQKNILDDWKRAHTIALQFCWHLRVGFFREVHQDKMVSYSRFFYDNFLGSYLTVQDEVIRHSGARETALKKMIALRRRLEKLFKSDTQVMRALSLVEDCLEEYIRLEQKNLTSSVQREDHNIDAAHDRYYSYLVNSYEKKLRQWSEKYWELR